MIGAITAGLFSTGVAASTNSYESISTVTVGAGGTSTITFSSIPSTYKHLQIRALAITSVVSQGAVVQFNGDSGANYKYHSLYGDGSAAAATNGSGVIAPFFMGGVFSPGSAVIDILDYANTNKYKTVRSLDGYDANGSGYVDLTSGLWLSTAAITSITLTRSTIQQYSSFALYGIKG